MIITRVDDAMSCKLPTSIFLPVRALLCGNDILALVDVVLFFRNAIYFLTKL